MKEGFTVWFTGLPCSGKSTLARRLERALQQRGRRCWVLDGDEVRTRICKGLGFSREDRDENIRRIAYVARAITHAGGIAITCAISPYRAVRAQARAEIGRFLEVFTDAPLEECIRRDVKGMYRRALAGELKNFTGVSDPYEPPEAPEVHLHTDRETEDACVEKILRKAEELGYLPSAGLPPPHGGTLVERRHEGSVPSATIPLEPDHADEVWDLVTGAFSPLDGFQSRVEVDSVLETGRLPSGLPWPIPIVLPVREVPADRLTLAWKGRPLAVLEVREVFDIDLERFCACVFGTTDASHPGVARVRNWPARCVAGRVALVEPPQDRLTRWSRTPRETRAEFQRRGWRSVVAFQTRNIPHLGHEWAQRMALAGVDGLLIHPLAGFKKAGDFRDEVIFESYEALIRHYYPPERVFLSALHLPMRYAGPREAVLHAILRKNFGATHFVVGRDHAGVGSFYDPFAAHRIFDEYPDLGITPLRYGTIFACVRCGAIVPDRSCGHGEEHRMHFSGTALRNALAGGAGADRVVRPEVAAVVARFSDPLVS